MATREDTTARFGAFAATAEVPPAARVVARDAVEDTVGVMLAGADAEGSRIIRALAMEECPTGPSRIVGTTDRTSAAWAALANGNAAHALDFDDMCWVTMAHPSAPLVAAGLAASEMRGRSGRALLDGYVVGFEIGAVLGRVMNPDHYAKGWHCTSTIGTLGAAGTAARVMGLDAQTAARALAIAASEASGVKANFGTMVKPLQVGLAARNGVLAALLAERGMTASPQAVDGGQGLLVAMCSAGLDLSGGLNGLGRHWEIVEGGITVKLYPSCAATHPTIDALLNLRSEHDINPASVTAVEILVDRVTPTVLVYDRPTTGLEGKFSLHFCAAAALVNGWVGIETFEPAAVQDPLVARLVERVTMRADHTLGIEAPPLTQARVTVRLDDGRSFERFADGARGYPERPPSRAERVGKFIGCATHAVPAPSAEVALTLLGDLESVTSVSALTSLLTPASEQTEVAARLPG